MKITRKQLRALITETLTESKANQIGQYVVRKNDTLSDITQRHSPGRSVEDNAELNGIKPPYTIHPGQNLKIYVTKEYEGELAEPPPGGPPKEDDPNS